MTTAKIKKALKGDKLNFVNVEKILSDYGYSVVLFNTIPGDMEIERYNLQKKALETKAFTLHQSARIVFIDGTLHADDRLYLALHELGHIHLKHIGDGKLFHRNKILIDMEADNFAYTIIKGEKKTTPFLIIAIILAALVSLFAIQSNNAPVSVPASAVPYEQKNAQTEIQETAQTDMVYITPSGSKFHRSGCRYTKNKTLTELSRSDASKRYAPCLVCKP